MEARVVVEGTVAVVRLRIVKDAQERFDQLLQLALGVAPEPGVESEELRRQLDADLTSEARHRLIGTGVRVAVNSQSGSPEILASIRATTLTMEIGAFLDALRELRSVVPEHVAARLDITLAPPRLEFGDDLLLGTGEVHDDTKKKTKTKKAQPTADSELSIRELAAYAGFALLVMLVVGAFVLAGVLIAQ